MEADDLTRLWRAHAARVMAYTRRHVDRADAEDIVSEVFVVAWRRRDDVPADALPWLLVVARNVISNHRRASRRRDALADVVRRLHAVAAPVASFDVGVREAAVEALAAMTDAEREALLLVAWDGPTPAQAAEVAGCTTGAFHVRLLRARRRLAGFDAPVTTPGETHP